MFGHTHNPVRREGTAPRGPEPRRNGGLGGTMVEVMGLEPTTS